MSSSGQEAFFVRPLIPDPSLIRNTGHLMNKCVGVTYFPCSLKVYSSVVSTVLCHCSGLKEAKYMMLPITLSYSNYFFMLFWFDFCYQLEISSLSEIALCMILFFKKHFFLGELVFTFTFTLILL